VKRESTVAGLDLDAARESALRSAFATWAEHFRSRLRERGLSGLLEDYTALVESLETQSCTHGANGTRRTGSNWQYCCGVSYEFSNDLSVRDAFEIIRSIAGPSGALLPLAEIAALDSRLYAFYEHRPARTGEWWRQGLPRGILP
jgi:hypothetical protein